MQIGTLFICLGLSGEVVRTDNVDLVVTNCYGKQSGITNWSWRTIKARPSHRIIQTGVTHGTADVAAADARSSEERYIDISLLLVV